MVETRPFLVNGEWRTGEGTFEVHSPYDGSVVAEIAVPTAADVEEASQVAHDTFEESKNLPIWARADALDHISKRLSETIEENANLIAAEGGKPLKWATVEATRAVSTFRWASEVIRHGTDEAMRLDTEQALGSRLGLLRRFPLGPVLGITPFNFPLNLVAHKVAPSLGVGAPIVVKPASATPIGSLRLAEFFAETDLPKGMFQVLPVSSKVADGMARDDRFKKISFTGSSEIGWYLKGLDPKKRVTLELGGNAGVIVHSDADLDFAAQRIAFGGYYQAGQSCISVQRVLVASEVYDDFAARLTKQVESLKVGDPMDPTVDVGPVIQAQEVERIQGWVDEAVSQGAQVLTGGTGEGPIFQPTLIADVKPEMKVCREEVFGPVVTISPYQTFDDALKSVNDSKYGLQAGVFTNDISRAMEAHRTLEVGGVIINDVSAFRADQMPYGGSKDSGFGREGLRFAMEEMTEQRIMVLSHVPL
ncbi:MAG TPA: aldehyde dehydrogenase family protein [Actinomycetota bacterium]|jgi:acyl-CoA reductase-like NAD-dependent aldehyde dehydrogenase|nr:aldehyde dehydrogenase family protein [Actinomycetota bacterium]